MQVEYGFAAPAHCEGTAALAAGAGRVGVKSVLLLQAPPALPQWQVVSGAGVVMVHGAGLVDNRGSDHTSFSYNVTWSQDVATALTVTLLGTELSPRGSPPTGDDTMALHVACTQPFHETALRVSRSFATFDDTGAQDGLGADAGGLAAIQIQNHGTWRLQGEAVRAYLGVVPGGAGTVALRGPEGAVTWGLDVKSRTLYEWESRGGTHEADLQTAGPRGTYWGMLIGFQVALDHARPFG
ncbi:MAG: hypothetical protein QOI63_240 [Thermoplasmata archaeon]|jgi:hypothetical protein|nr:hypothetical protein [Thermoplasmata archaeon]